jgi:acetyltransferase-like isoleucine patch superfamily enzyme
MIDNSNSPSWAHEPPKKSGQIKELAQLVTLQVQARFMRYIIYRGNKLAYLRHLGTHIGSNCSILTRIENFGSEPWLIEIGNRVTVTAGVIFLTHDGASRVFRQSILGSSQYGNRFGTIRIFDNSFIGVNSIILPDVQVGPNSIVGAGSVVTKTVPPNMVVAGMPAQPIYTLEEYIERYQSKMVPITASTRKDLRRELTQYFWNETR